MTRGRALTEGDVAAIANAIAKPKKRHGQALRLLRDVVLSASDYAQCVATEGAASAPARIARGRLNDDLIVASEFLSKIDEVAS